MKVFFTPKNGLLAGILLFISLNYFGQTNRILMFVSHEQTYYSEYIVALRGLQAAGYTVDVRSADAMDFSTYMVPSNADIVSTANSLTGSSYAQFTQQFQDQFGAAWNPSYNSTPTLVTHNGKIQDVTNMSNYDAFIIPGGTGSIEFRLDGTYNSVGTGTRTISSATVQAAAQKVNDLVIDALMTGKPVFAQCHGAGIPVFCRVPSTTGPGAETLGYSILKGRGASGYPSGATTTDYATLQVTHLTMDRTTVSTPHSSLAHNGHGDFKIVTSADWYPQTIVHGTRTLLNILQTYPTKAQRETNISCLVLHGGMLDSLNCSAANLANDVPCNYGTNTANLPADYRHLVNLLNASSPQDNYSITATHLNLSGTLPYNGTLTSSILSYLQQYNVVVFYKHWSTSMSTELQNALVSYADNSGGVLAIHHGLYNHINGSQNKNILVNQLFGAESSASGWSANRTNYDMYSTNYGHFVSTYGVTYSTSTTDPPAWSTNTIMPSSNTSFSTYHRFALFDEIYNNMNFVVGQTFGRNVNQINPLFSNNLNPSAQCHTNGFAKLFNPTLDASIGRAIFLQAGETRANYYANLPYGQVLRNSVIWLGQNITTSTTGLNNNSISKSVRVYPNPNSGKFTIALEKAGIFELRDILGKTIRQWDLKAGENILELSELNSGTYFITSKEALSVHQKLIICK